MNLNHIRTIGEITVPREYLGKVRIATKNMTSELPLEIEELIDGKNKSVTYKLRGEAWAIEKASKAIDNALEVDEEKEPWQL